MMKLRGEELQVKAYAVIETAAAAELAAWADALREVGDPKLRANLENAALQLAGAWLDAALLVGFEMARTPEKFLFVEQEPTPTVEQEA